MVLVSLVAVVLFLQFSQRLLWISECLEYADIDNSFEGFTDVSRKIHMCVTEKKEKLYKPLQIHVQQFLLNLLFHHYIKQGLNWNFMSKNSWSSKSLLLLLLSTCTFSTTNIPHTTTTTITIYTTTIDTIGLMPIVRYSYLSALRLLHCTFFNIYS